MLHTSEQSVEGQKGQDASVAVSRRPSLIGHFAPGGLTSLHFVDVVCSPGLKELSHPCRIAPPESRSSGGQGLGPFWLDLSAGAALAAEGVMEAVLSPALPAGRLGRRCFIFLYL